MFTYLDPAVRERLVDEGKLIRVDREGKTLAPEERTGGQAISILGPIPLPLQNGERDVTVDWYACVRNTELSKVEELADQLREQHTQQLFANLASSMAVNCVLLIGDRAAWSNPLVRVHLQDTLGDVVGVHSPSLGWPIDNAFRRIAQEEIGVVVLLRDQESSRDFMEAVDGLDRTTDDLTDRRSGDAVLRTYGIGAQILRDLGLSKIRVFSAPKHMYAISGFDLEITEYVEQ